VSRRHAASDRFAPSEIVFWLAILTAFALWISLACMPPRERRLMQRRAVPPAPPWSVDRRAPV
jgi:hypothetical protein